MKTIREIIENIPAGRFFRISYRSELPLKAEYKKQGVKIVKYTTTTTRTGVQYSHIKGVVPSENSKYTSYYAWIVRNKIKRNINSGKDYVQLAPIWKGSNKKTSLYLTNSNGTRKISDDEIKEYVIPSYFSKGEAPKVISVSLDNVIGVNA